MINEKLETQPGNINKMKFASKNGIKQQNKNDKHKEQKTTGGQQI